MSSRLAIVYVIGQVAGIQMRSSVNWELVRLRREPKATKADYKSRLQELRSDGTKGSLVYDQISFQKSENDGWLYPPLA